VRSCNIVIIKTKTILDHLRLALDWTPNTNHTGFYVALARGYYEREGIDLSIASPHTDNYEKTPARKLADGEIDLAIAPTESVLSYQTSDNWVDMVAIAAILAEDCSAIVSLQDSGIDHPKKLDKATYASYGARFEDGVVRAMIRQDGGLGEPSIIYPEKLGIWNTLVQGEAQATWVFMPWEGVEAQRDGLTLNAFKLADYDIPYGYSPLLISERKLLQEKPGVFRRFLKATRDGFRFAIDQPDAAADLLVDTCGFDQLDREMVRESQRAISPCYQSKRLPWGYMEMEVWDRFVHWLQKELILVNRAGEPIFDLTVEELFSNDYLPERE